MCDIMCVGLNSTWDLLCLADSLSLPYWNGEVRIRNIISLKAPMDSNFNKKQMSSLRKDIRLPKNQCTSDELYFTSLSRRIRLSRQADTQQ